jgi:predicted nucleotidyltransferase
MLADLLFGTYRKKVLSLLLLHPDADYHVRELAGLLRKTTGAAQVLTDALAPLAPSLALIFGSVASGTETANSDVDLLVIGDLGFADVVRATHPAQAELDREINPVVYSAAEFQRRVLELDPFVTKILANARLFLTGTDHDLSQFASHTTPAGV